MRDAAIVEIVQWHAVRVDLETAAHHVLAAIDPKVSLVLIGEATHGTHEFYRIRADVTRALIQHRGFTCVAAEAGGGLEPPSGPYRTIGRLGKER